MDIAPTLLELAAVEPPSSMEGQSLAPLMGDGDGRYTPIDRVISSECTWQAKWSLRTDRYKLILARSVDFYGSPERELYDRVADPAETHNLAEEKSEIADALTAELEEWIAQEIERLGRSGDPVVEQGRDKFAKKWSGASTPGLGSGASYS